MIDIDPRRMVAFDLETTGLDLVEDRIVTACLVGHDGVRLDLRMNPGIPIPAEATRIHGITDADVAGAIPYQQGIAMLGAALQDVWTTGMVIVGHNILGYDLPFFRMQERYVFGSAQVEFGQVFDTCTTFRKMFPGKPARLVSACAHFGLPEFNAHNAVADATASLHLAAAMAAA